jgi:methionine sulfoxide reductase heme-binding subunit
VIALAASPGSPLWYAARSAGVVSLLLLTSSLVLGMATSARLELASGGRYLLQGLHRSLSLLVVVFLSVHVAAAYLDPFAKLGLPDVLLPFASAYRPLWLGLGVVAAELFVALLVTSLLRRRFRLRWWRLVHWASYACWPAALLHGLGTGTDSGSAWFFALNALCVLVAADAVIALRILRSWPAARRRRLAAAGLVALAVLGTAGFYAAGPAQPGWARAAGTPEQLLNGGSPPGGPGPSPSGSLQGSNPNR